MSSLLISSRTGAIVTFGTTLLGKFYMSFGHRVREVLMGKKNYQAHLQSDKYKMDSRTQLNEAEYGPWICAILLYLASQGVDAKLGTTLACLGNTGYLVFRLSFGVKLWNTSPFAATRYCGLMLLGKALYDVLTA